MIHCFKYDDINIVLDVASNSVHVVDDCCYDILTGANLDKWSPAVISSARSELSELESKRLLNSDETGQIHTYKGGSQVKALCLHVAHDCNLRCKYCFAGTGTFGQDRSVMDYDTAKAAVDFIVKASCSRKHCEIDFFGGEPLVNFEVVKRTVAYIKDAAEKSGKIFKLTLTTNAVALDADKLKFLNDENISLVLSIDGRKAVHDEMRPDCAGKGSYMRVMDNIGKAVLSRSGNNYYVRGTFTAKNLDFSNDIFHLAESGFDEISVEPVVTEIEELRLKEEHLPVIFRQYELVAEKLLEMRLSGRNINFFHYNIDLSGGPCIAKRVNGCGAGNDYLAVAPDGSLYPCHQFVGRKEYIVGNIYTGVVNDAVCSAFREANVYSKEECLKCWAKYFCSGGCHASNLADSGDLHKPYKLGCELQKKRLEMALWLKAKLFMLQAENECC